MGPGLDNCDILYPIFDSGENHVDHDNHDDKDNHNDYVNHDDHGPPSIMIMLIMMTMIIRMTIILFTLQLSYGPGDEDGHHLHSWYDPG